MNTDRLEQLLWERHDGTINDRDLAELEAVLAEHPEPRELEREIARLAEELDELDQVTPPAELRNRISHALAEAAPGSAHRVAVHPAARSSWTHQWLPIAASIVIGVAIGYLIHPGAGTGVDASHVAGTMYGPVTPGETPAIEIDLGNDRGTVTARRTDSTVTIDVDLTGSHATRVGVEVADGVLTFDADSRGAHHFTVEAIETTDVTIVVSAAGVMVASRTIHGIDRSEP